VPNLTDRFRVAPGSKVRLADLDPRDTAGLDKEQAAALLAKARDKMFILQRRLYAESRRGLLIILQGMDASGKDGTIREAFASLNPQGTRVVSFKAPTSTERSQDYLWRIHQVCPPRGEVHIFNRSHYEDVLVVRVEGLVPEKVWKRRYEHINAFEKMLTDEGTVVLKFFLNLSKDEQRERLLDRVHDPERHFKFNPGDFDSRKKWDQYVEAFEAALENCSTDDAPWHIIPSDRNWLRNYAVAAITLDALERMDPQLPKVAVDAAAAEAMLDG
jgi:PPK2 family polyphosphate:nucleotide phosphotransferase